MIGENTTQTAEQIPHFNFLCSASSAAAANFAHVTDPPDRRSFPNEGMTVVCLQV
jgi:hypothetical protein